VSATKSTIPRPDAATLRALYVDQGQGAPDIGKRFGRDPTTILKWLREAGIATRPRGSNPAVHFQPGHALSYGRKKSREEKRKIRDATVARGGVPYLRDGQHWLKDAPAEANPNWKGGITAERQAFYRSTEWKVACVVVWKRADAHCERCGADHRRRDRRTEPAFHVHHVVSFAIEALRADPANLALLCRPCHLFVHSAANVAQEFLPAGYFTDALFYLKAEERKAAMPTLFDLDAVEAAA
jgi:hypothetical protein